MDNINNNNFDYGYMAFFKELGLNPYEPEEGVDNGNTEDHGGYQNLPGYGEQIQNTVPFYPLQQQYMQNAVTFNPQQYMQSNFQYQQIQNELPPSYEESMKNKK